MKSDKQLCDICMNIYRQMYREAMPSADLDELISQGVTVKPNWFLDYYLPMERQEEIIEYYCKLNKLPKFQRKKIYGTVMLGVSPRGDYKSI